MSLFTGGLAIAALAGSAAGSVYGAHKASSSADKAGKIADKANTAALDYTKQHDAQDRSDALAAEKANYDQYVSREARLAPYRAAGQGATQTMSHLLGLPDVQIAPPPPAPAYLSGGSGTPVAATAAPLMTQAGGSPTVMLQAPNGQRKAVPQAQAQHYIQQGAKVIG